MSTATEYKGPIPPPDCIQSRFGADGSHIGILYKQRGGGAVFEPFDAPAYAVDSWRDSGLTTHIPYREPK